MIPDVQNVKVIARVLCHRTGSPSPLPERSQLMSLDRICERCDEEHSAWTVCQATFVVGKLQSKMNLCEACTRTIQEVLRRALKRKDQ